MKGRPQVGPKRAVNLLVALAPLIYPVALAAQGPLVYGYVSYYPAQATVTSSNEMAWLNQYHVNYVQFYDWQWKHHWPLAGTITTPQSLWNDIANRTNYRRTVNDFINTCHAFGMKAMAYNLMYGAYANYATDSSGVSAQWGLYNSPGGSQWSDGLPGLWATSALVMFNPSNTLWQNYIFGRENDMFSAYAFDGWHVDQLGDPGGLKYDSNGNPVDLWQTFVNFLNNAQAATGKRIIFNNVGTYGLFSVASETAEDAVYVECWEANGQTTYNDLKAVIDDGLAWGHGKPVVLAAYLDRGKTSGSFNPPGVLLCDATIFASGGTHIELGDNGHMLDNEYFPNQSLSLSPGLAGMLTNYYNFILDYKTWLYGGLVNSPNVVALGNAATNFATPNKVWVFAKTNALMSMLNLINLSGESSVNWRDNSGTYPVPTPQSNFVVKYYPGSGNVGSVRLASPDINGGVLSHLAFTNGTDSGGSFVTFNVPGLLYWDMILVANAGPQLLAPYVSGTNFQFSVATVGGASYTVWANTNLASTNWASQMTFTGDGATNQVLLPIPPDAVRQFYRITQP